MREGFSFEVETRLPGTLARTGVLKTPHGEVRTPVYCPVGTCATVKALDADELEAAGAQMILANTYHLLLRPGPERVRELGGLHDFMSWRRPVFTDSGGFQAFSLGYGKEHGVGKIGGVFPITGEGPQPPSRGKHAVEYTRMAHIDEEGVTFRSHLDGSTHRLTPEISIGIQQKLGADIIVAFDECTSPLSDHAYTARAMERTHRWARRCLAAHGPEHPQALLGIVQGGAYEDLRRQSTEVIAAMPFDGFAIGGSLGKTKDEMLQVLEWTVPGLPDGRFRHLLGIGDVDDLFECVERGVDSFDCVIPTRFARHGTLFVSHAYASKRRFRININNAQYGGDQRPIEPGCACPACRRYTRAYIHHLFRAGEILGYRLATVHNVWFMQRLMDKIRASLIDGTFATLKATWLGA